MGKSVSLLLTAALCIIALFCSCDARRGVVTVRVVATSDVHGNVFGHDALDGKERDGSLAKIASLLKKERKENGNLVYLDAGDILQGSVEMYMDNTAEFVKPNLAGSAYNLLGCDAMALGNHELAIGLESSDRFLSTAGFPVLAANIGFSDYGDYYPPYQIIERHGVRIAVLGLVTPAVEYTIPADIMGEFGVCDLESAASHWIPVLREEEKADVIIGLVHSGIENDRSRQADAETVDRIDSLMERISGFDMIIYGHDHRAGISRRTDSAGDSIWVANPGPYAENAVVADISLDFRSGSTPEPVIGAWIENVSSLRPDADFEKALADRWDDTQAYCDSVIGTLDIPLVARDALWNTSSAVDFIHSVHMSFYGAQVSVTSAVQNVDVIPAGKVTMRDMFSVYPFDNTMVSLMLTGNEIRRLLEYSADRYYNTVSDQNPGLLRLERTKNGSMKTEYPAEQYLTAAGIVYTIDVTKAYGERVRVLSMSDGSAFNPDSYYRTTISSFLFGGSESVLGPATGLSGMELQERLCASTKADIRYYMITRLALARDAGKSITVKKLSDWSLIPEKTVDEYLAKDTIDLKTTH